MSLICRAQPPRHPEQHGSPSAHHGYMDTTITSLQDRHSPPLAAELFHTVLTKKWWNGPGVIFQIIPVR